MVKRLFLTCTLSFVIAGLGLLLVPYLGRLAEPVLCQGSLEPETRLKGLQYRCVAAADGRITPVDTGAVLLVTLPALTALLLLPIYTLIAGAERRAARARHTMSADLAVAVRARAEILRVARRGSLRRQALLRNVELQLVLWVQPPEGRPYEAKVTWMVEDESLARLVVGAIVPVRVNPRRPEHIYPDQPWAHYAWWS